MTTALNEFIIPAMRNELCESVDILQVDVGVWLAEYNLVRPHQGYRNLGKRPIERIDEFVKEQSHKEEDAEEVVIEKSLPSARNDA